MRTRDKQTVCACGVCSSEVDDNSRIFLCSKCKSYSKKILNDCYNSNRNICFECIEKESQDLDFERDVRKTMLEDYIVDDENNNNNSNSYFENVNDDDINDSNNDNNNNNNNNNNNSSSSNLNDWLIRYKSITSISENKNSSNNQVSNKNLETIIYGESCKPLFLEECESNSNRKMWTCVEADTVAQRSFDGYKYFYCYDKNCIPSNCTRIDYWTRQIVICKICYKYEHTKSYEDTNTSQVKTNLHNILYIITTNNI